MRDERKTKSQLIEELEHLRAELQAAGAATPSGAEALDAPALRALVQLAPEPLYAVDLEGRIIVANELAAEMMGYASAADLLDAGMSAADFVVPEEQERSARTIRELAQNHEAQTVERTLVRRDGTRFPGEISARALWPIQGTPYGILAAIRDYSERRKAEIKLRDSEEKFRNLVAAANDAIFLADAETGELLEANDAATKLLGRPVDEIVGQHQSTLHPPEEAERYAQVFRDHVASGRALLTGLEAQHRDGRRVPIEISASVFKIGDRRVILGIFRDITTRRQVETALAERASALARANIELEKLHRSKDEFIATVSHELRTPLVTGMGYIELLLEGLLGPVAASMNEKMSVALKNLKRLSRLIDNILDFQRLSRRDFTEVPKFSVIDPAGLLRETATEFVMRSGRSPSTVRTEVPDTLPAIRADRDMLSRAVSKLLDNAARHAGPEARITLRAETEARGVRIAVIDDGVGMTAEFRDRAFEPFARADSTGPGTGLGLAIVREILKSHGAPVLIESEPGAGTTVRFTVPATALDARCESQDAPAAPPAAIANARVLVVDDDTDMLDFIQLALTQRGYRVRIAASAERALSLLEREAADLILLDMALPGMNGDELCRRLKSRATTSEIPVLMFSARTERSARTSAEAAGCDGYLVKPISLADLLGAIRLALAG